MKPVALSLRGRKKWNLQCDISILKLEESEARQLPETKVNEKFDIKNGEKIKIKGFNQFKKGHLTRVDQVVTLSDRTSSRPCLTQVRHADTNYRASGLSGGVATNFWGEVVGIVSSQLFVRGHLFGMDLEMPTNVWYIAPVHLPHDMESASRDFPYGNLLRIPE